MFYFVNQHGCLVTWKQTKSTPSARTLNPLIPKSDQRKFSPNRKGKRYDNWINEHQKKKCFDLYQILPTNSLRKSMEISLENLYGDITA